MYLVGVPETGKLKNLYENLVDPEDPQKYRITWCGRFSVPFGLNCIVKVCQGLDHTKPSGMLMRYSTSVALGELDRAKNGPGITAPGNLHHWVGYAAIGYKIQ